MYSIIIPAYNCEGYLSLCLDSIQRQSCAAWEVILVDDGSTDGTGTIADTYAAQDPRIRVIHKANGGVSSSRNRGLAEATYENILFCDSDDQYAENFLASLSAAPAEADIVAFSYRQDFYDIETALIVKSLFHGSTDGGYTAAPIAELFDTLVANDLLAAPWNKVYRKHIIETHGLRFDEQSVCYEDYAFNLDYLTHCQTVVLLHTPLYHYRCMGLSPHVGKRKFRSLFGNADHFTETAERFSQTVLGTPITGHTALHYGTLRLYLYEAHTHLLRSPETERETLRALHRNPTFCRLLTPAKGKLYTLLRLLGGMKLYGLEKKLLMKRFGSRN